MKRKENGTFAKGNTGGGGTKGSFFIITL